MNLSVINASYLEGHKIRISFSDGKNQVVDFWPFLKKHPHAQHDKYREIKNFKKFYIDDGNLVWGKDWDIIFHIMNLYYNDLESDLE